MFEYTANNARQKKTEMEEWIIDPVKLTEREDHFTTEH